MPQTTLPPTETSKPYCDQCGVHRNDCRCAPSSEPADIVNHPPHYTKHPSGVECIEVTEHFDFCPGNAIKYIWRAGLKDDNSAIQDLQKAAWYIQREIERLQKMDRD